MKQKSIVDEHAKPGCDWDFFEETKRQLEQLGIRRFKVFTVNGQKTLWYHDGLRWHGTRPAGLDDPGPWEGTLEHLELIQQTMTRDVEALKREIKERVVEKPVSNQGEIMSNPENRQLMKQLFLARRALDPIDDFLKNRPSKQRGLAMFWAGYYYLEYLAFFGSAEARKFHRQGRTGKRAKPTARVALRFYLTKQWQDGRGRPVVKDVLRDLPQCFELKGKTQRNGIIAEGRSEPMTEGALRSWIREEWGELARANNSQKRSFST